MAIGGKLVQRYPDPVLAVLVVLFLLLPLAELAVIVQMSHAFGFANTLVALSAISVTGAWLVKREGLGVLRRLQDRMTYGELPGRELVDGFLILLAGALMLTPGFITDVFGVLLLLPPTRAGVRALLMGRLRHRVEVRGSFGGDGRGDGYRPPPRGPQPLP